MSSLHLILLGGCSLQFDGQSTVSFPTDKTRALLAYLALTSARPQARSVLSGLLWPETDESTARANLRVTLHRLNQILEAADPVQGRKLLTPSRQMVQFNPARAFVDVLAFEAKLKVVATHAHLTLDGCESCLAALSEAVGLYQGPLLAGISVGDAPPFEEWLQLRRAYLQQQAIDACEALAAALESKQELTKALALAHRQLELDNFREENHRRVMRLLARQGRREAALSHYDGLRQLLRTELGVEPADATTALVRQISTGFLEEVPATLELVHPVATPRSDWSQAPIVGSFFGRSQEVHQLEAWLLATHVQVVGLLGMGGVGKSTLAAHLVRNVAGHFEVALWYSLLNGPPLAELLSQILVDLTARPRPELPQRLDEQLTQLLEQLRTWRCLLVLDNVETVLQTGEADELRSGYAEYSQLFDLLGTREHQSTLLFTSREQPPGLERLASAGAAHTLVLHGLDNAAVQDILHTHHLRTSASAAAELAHHYSGNPLALNLVAQAIADFYGSDVDDFLADEMPIFDDIRDVLSQQIQQLTSLERDIMTWLAVARRPLKLPQLRAYLLEPIRPRNLLQALRSLQRRSLLVKSGDGFTLQNVIIEYLTERLVDTTVSEIEQGRPDGINRFVLLEAQAQDYVRQIQARMLLAPIAARLLFALSRPQIAAAIQRILDELRKTSPPQPGYATGNIIDLLLHMGISPADYDFSHLCVWQASLNSQTLAGVDFTGADLAHTVFDSSFRIVWTVACSPDGDLIAAGTIDGSITLWHASTVQLLASWTAHAGAVYTLDFRPDGLMLASGGADGVIHLWDVVPPPLSSAADMAPLGRTVTSALPHAGALRGHTAAVQQVLFRARPDDPSQGRRGGWQLISTSDDLTIRLWSVTTGETLRTLRGHTDFIIAAALSPDGRWLASGSRGNTDEARILCLWDLESGVQLCALEHGAWVNAVAFSPDGCWLASGDDAGLLRLWRLDPEQLPVPTGSATVLRGHGSAILALAFSANGRVLATGSGDRTIRLWDVATWQVRHVLTGHTGWVSTVAFDPSSTMLVSGGWDCTVREWDSQTGQALRTVHGGTTSVFCVAFNPAGTHLATTGSDGIGRIWNVATGKVVQSLPLVGDMGWRIAYSPDGYLLADTNFTGEVRLWAPQPAAAAGSRLTWQCVYSYTEEATSASALAFAPDNRRLAASFLSGTVLLLDLAEGAPQPVGEVFRRLEGHAGWCLTVAFSPDGGLLASSGADGRIILWDSALGSVARVLQGHDSGIQEVVFSPDGTLLASASWDHTICLWDVATGRLVHRLAGHTDIAQGVAFHPDGSMLASCGYDGTIRLWDVAQGSAIRVLRGPGNWVHFVTFSPDGGCLASGSADGSIRLWNPQNGTCAATWNIPGPYAGMKISGVTGISEAQRAALLALGAVDESGSA